MYRVVISNEYVFLSNEDGDEPSAPIWVGSLVFLHAIRKLHGSGRSS